MLYKISALKKIRKFHMKTLVLECLFIEVVGLPFLQNNCGGCFCTLQWKLRSWDVARTLHKYLILRKKWSFLLRISSVNVTKFFCEFGHIYWRNSNWKTSFFVQWFDRDFHSYRSFWVQLQFEISIQQFLFIAESCF